MYCPNCGNKNAAEQKFCRSCGLGLSKIAQSVSEQLPTELEENLQQRTEKLQRLGVGALSVFGVGVLSVLLYNAFTKLMLTKGPLLAALILLVAVVVVGCGLLSVILFAKANELKEASGKRQLTEPKPLELPPTDSTRELLPEPQVNQPLSITEHTTELLVTDKKERR
jgi:hypothetical protein